MIRQENSFIFDQVGLTSDGITTENQYLKLTAIDGELGVFYQLDTKGGQWSFSEEEDITDMLKKFISTSEGLR